VISVRKTKKLPLVYTCKGCVFCVVEYLDNIVGRILAYRCKNRDLDYKYKNTNPLENL